MRRQQLQYKKTNELTKLADFYRDNNSVNLDNSKN